MSKRHRLSEQEWNEIMEKLKNKTSSIAQLSREYKLARSSIYLHCRKYSYMQFKKEHRLKKQMNREEIIKDLKETWNPNALQMALTKELIDEHANAVGVLYRIMQEKIKEYEHGQTI